LRCKARDDYRTEAYFVYGAFTLQGGEGRSDAGYAQAQGVRRLLRESSISGCRKTCRCKASGPQQMGAFLQPEGNLLLTV
jgi:hypothetical protein